MKNGILPIAFALFAAYFYAKNYSNSTIMAGFYDEFMKKKRRIFLIKKSKLVYFTFKIF